MKFAERMRRRRDIAQGIDREGERRRANETIREIRLRTWKKTMGQLYERLPAGVLVPRPLLDEVHRIRKIALDLLVLAPFDAEFFVVQNRDTTKGVINLNWPGDSLHIARFGEFKLGEWFPSENKKKKGGLYRRGSLRPLTEEGLVQWLKSL